MEVEAIDAEKLRSQFLHVLCSRRSAPVPLTVEPGKPVVEPIYQESPNPLFREELESCPKANISNFRELLKEENFYLITEEGEQGRLPVLILSMKESNHQRRPANAIVFIHSRNKSKEWLRPFLEVGFFVGLPGLVSSGGYIAVAIDCRYHGERASSLTTYRDALVLSWKKVDTMPFIFDTVWDLIKLADYLTQREDIDPCRIGIGITGISLGGTLAWFAAAADTRYSVVVPIIGVQGGKEDRCPLEGLKIPIYRAGKAYEDAHCPDNFKLIAEPGVCHGLTPSMVKEASDWFDKFLK